MDRGLFGRPFSRCRRVVLWTHLSVREERTSNRKGCKEADAKIAEESPAPLALQTLRPLRLFFRTAKDYLLQVAGRLNVNYET